MPGLLGLTDLPTELLLCVYQSLDDIDDALHLARSCRRLYRVFNDPANRHGILKSIIVRYHEALYCFKKEHPSGTDYCRSDKLTITNTISSFLA
jgi:hypothetical protein